MTFKDIRKADVRKCGTVLGAHTPLDNLPGRPGPGDAMVCAVCGTPHILQEDFKLSLMTAEQLAMPEYEDVRKLVEDAMLAAAMGNIQLP